MPPDSMEPSISDPCGGVGAAGVLDGTGDGAVEAVPAEAWDVPVDVGPLVGEHAIGTKSATTRTTRWVAGPIRGQIVSAAIPLASEPAPA